jgi:hypothetical protein
MRRAILTALLAALCLSTAPRAAEDALVGFYRADGKSPDGKPYTASVQIVKTDQTYHVRWVTGQDEESIGVGLLHKNILVVAFAGGPMIGLVRYEVKKKELKGTWTFVSYGGVLSETLTRVEGKPGEPPPAAHPPVPPSREPDVRERVLIDVHVSIPA